MTEPRKGFRRSTRFLSELQEWFVIRQLMAAGGPVHCASLVSNESRLGKWFTPNELYAVLQRAIFERVKRNDTFMPYAIVSPMQVVPFWHKDFESAMTENVRQCIKRFSPHWSEKVKSGHYSNFCVEEEVEEE
jgi:hypothetical protein